jgi:hypothetical protein
MKANMNFFYCFLSPGNRDEFLSLDCELIRRGVDASISYIPAGGRLYRIPGSDLQKLPSNEKGHCLGGDNSGHSIYKLGDFEYNSVVVAGPEWVSLLKISQEAKNAVEAYRYR